MKEWYQNLRRYPPELDARKVSSFVAVSTLFVALLASLGGEWVSFATTPVEKGCEQDIGRARFFTYFPNGRMDPSRTLIVELYNDAFVKDPLLEIATEDPDQPFFCPDLSISFTNLPEMDSVAFQVTHPEERYTTFSNGLIGVSIELQDNTVTSYRAHRTSAATR